MGGEQAAKVLSTVKQDQLKAAGEKVMNEKELKDFERPTLEKYETEGSPYYSSARLWDDGIIDPAKTRDLLGLLIPVSLNSPSKCDPFP